MLIVIASNEQQTAATPYMNTMTYGGQAMTSVGREEVSSGYTGIIDVWMLDEAGIAAASSSTITPSWSSSPHTPLYAHAVFMGIDQVTPLGSWVSATTPDDTPNPVPVGAISTAAGDMVVAAAYAGKFGSYIPQNGFMVGINHETAEGGSQATGTAYKRAIGVSETISMLFDPSTPTINRQVVIGQVLRVKP